MNSFRLAFIKVRMRYFPHLSGKYDMNEILLASGISVGKGTIFYNPGTMVIDRSRPYLLQIGEYCKITSGVTILTHDYSRSVLRRVYGDVVGEGKKTIIGNNVFVGINSIILMGAHVGDNVIIGAGSVVSGSIPNNVVVAGNPARIIQTLDEHYEIKKRQMLKDAKACVLAYYEKYNKAPQIGEIGAFWPLFLPREEKALAESKINYNLNGDEPSEVVRDFLNGEAPMFSGYEDFLNYCFSNNA